MVMNGLMLNSQDPPQVSLKPQSLDFLDGKDKSIRLRVLDFLYVMVSYLPSIALQFFPCSEELVSSS